MELHLDIETFSSEDLKKAGVYKYCESPDFEILMIAYAYDENPVQVIDLAAGKEIPDHIKQSLMDHNITKVAHNAAFERVCFKSYGFDTPLRSWKCTLVMAAYAGFPLGLGKAAEAMGLPESKDKEGASLIRYFSKPCKPTKSNGKRSRNFWHHDKDRWEAYKLYCQQDVTVERQIQQKLNKWPVPQFEWEVYWIDQEINDRGVRVDLDFVEAVRKIDDERAGVLFQEMKKISGLENPNSTAQLRDWLTEAIGRKVTTVAKDEVLSMIEETGSSAVKKLLGLRLEAAKSSIKKYIAMESCACSDGRARGLFQFYGANRTGRWAGRLIQLQNLPGIKMKDHELITAKRLYSSGDYDAVSFCYGNISNVMSQLIRPSFIAKEGTLFAVSDFSAIEARVIAWLAREQWRLDVFSTHGKIYEASASMMYGVPMEKIKKGSPERQKGKVAELALGYQGSVGAMKAMGAEDMGISEMEMKDIVRKWREKSPNIVKMWYDLQRAAVACIQRKTPVKLNRYRGIVFEHDGECMTIQLPSGKKLYYQGAEIMMNKFDQLSIKYNGMKDGRWVSIDTYGGKLAENIVQAISRDLLAYSMIKLHEQGFDIVLHVHDEVAAEVPIENYLNAHLDCHDMLNLMYEIMSEPVPWAEGLPLEADGYLSGFYKKD